MPTRTKKPTVREIRQAYTTGRNGHFFSRDTMKFFGDTMSSFGTIQLGGIAYLVRRPNATVGVFGEKRKAGREYFGAWEFDPNSGDLSPCDEDTKAILYRLSLGIFRR